MRLANHPFRLSKHASSGFGHRQTEHLLEVATHLVSVGKTCEFRHVVEVVAQNNLPRSAF